MPNLQHGKCVSIGVIFFRCSREDIFNHLVIIVESWSIPVGLVGFCNLLLTLRRFFHVNCYVFMHVIVIIPLSICW
jgi:hypothetical protein